MLLLFRANKQTIRKSTIDKEILNCGNMIHQTVKNLPSGERQQRRQIGNLVLLFFQPVHHKSLVVRQKSTQKPTRVKLSKY